MEIEADGKFFWDNIGKSERKDGLHIL